MTLNEKKQNKYDKGLTVLVCMIQSGFQNLSFGNMYMEIKFKDDKLLEKKLY